jgi:hypothetical protein
MDSIHQHLAHQIGQHMLQHMSHNTVTNTTYQDMHNTLVFSFTIHYSVS